MKIIYSQGGIISPITFMMPLKEKNKRKNDMRSLDECLDRGPIMLQDICILLMYFTSKRTGTVANIEKVFLQVGLQDQDRVVIRFL